MKNNFQIILIVVFIIAAVFGVLVFSGAIKIGGGSTTTGQGTVVLWGTAKSAAINPLLEVFNAGNPDYTVQYVEKDSSSFDQDLLEALAAGKGPDLFFLPDNLAHHYENKIFTIPYSNYPIASFKSNFAGAGEVFLNNTGVLAFPLTIDPLVMYYNRSILDANGVVYPPKYWDEFVDLVPKLTKKDDANKISKSAVALGHFSNVTHAKDILSALFMQAGNPIVSTKNGSLTSTLTAPSSINPSYDLGSVLKFYTNFADPAQTVYSWNKSFPSSSDYFSTDNMAFYFGFASELSALSIKNPNQDFLVAPMPQIKNAPFKLTGAHVTGLAISAFSKNFNTAFLAASQMATGDFAAKLAPALGMAPARRDLLAQKPNDPFSPIFYDSALYARSWLDPSPKDTDNIFAGMVNAVLLNSLTPANAVSDASSKLSLLLIK